MHADLIRPRCGASFPLSLLSLMAGSDHHHDWRAGLPPACHSSCRGTSGPSRCSRQFWLKLQTSAGCPANHRHHAAAGRGLCSPDAGVGLGTVRVSQASVFAHWHTSFSHLCFSLPLSTSLVAPSLSVSPFLSRYTTFLYVYIVCICICISSYLSISLCISLSLSVVVFLCLFCSFAAFFPSRFLPRPRLASRSTCLLSRLLPRCAAHMQVFSHTIPGHLWQLKQERHRQRKNIKRFFSFKYRCIHTHTLYVCMYVCVHV